MYIYIYTARPPCTNLLSFFASTWILSFNQRENFRATSNQISLVIPTWLLQATGGYWAPEFRGDRTGLILLLTDGGDMTGGDAVSPKGWICNVMTRWIHRKSWRGWLPAGLDQCHGIWWKHFYDIYLIWTNYSGIVEKDTHVSRIDHLQNKVGFGSWNYGACWQCLRWSKNNGDGVDRNVGAGNLRPRFPGLRFVKVSCLLASRSDVSLNKVCRGHITKVK